MRLIPALGRAGEATPPPLLPRFAADFDVLRLAALVRPVERLVERLRFDLLGTEVWWLGGNGSEMRRASRSDGINGL